MKRYAFLYNPAAQGGRSDKKLARLQEFITDFKTGYLFHSQQIHDITDFIDQNFDKFDVFVACGGDGTVREVAARLINSSKKMGIIPMGTGNDLCKTLEIPVEMDRSIDLLRKGNTAHIDIGKCNDFIFLNVLGFGFDGLTNRFAVQHKYLHPLLTYSISALRAVIDHSPFQVSITEDGKTHEEDAIMLTLANGRVEGGSFWIAPKASITDGKLNCVIIKPISKWLIPILLPLFLLKKPELIPHVQSKKVKELSVTFSKKVHIHADGEMIKTASNKFSIGLYNNGLEVICGL